MEERKDGQKDRQTLFQKTLFQKTLPATAGGPKR